MDDHVAVMTESQHYALWLMLHEIRRNQPDAEFWATRVLGHIEQMMAHAPMEPKWYTNGTVIDVGPDVTWNE